MYKLRNAARSVIPEVIYDAIRRVRQTRMTRTFSPYQVERSYGGKNLRIHIADPIGEEWYDRPLDLIPEIEFLQRLDLQDKTIFDLGAHQCVVALLLAELVGERGKVVAVEANTHNQQVALRNIALNGRNNIKCLKSIVSSGHMNVAIDGSLNGRVRAVGQVNENKVVTIDQMTERFGEPALVFLDIEGHEIEALKGARRTLSSASAHWFIELHGDEALRNYGHKNSDVFDFFDERRYAFSKLDQDASEFTSLTRDNLSTQRCHVFFEQL